MTDNAPLARKIDLAPLDRLLHLAGRDGTLILLTTLINDMKITQTGLDTAWKGPDYTQLRSHSHVLIALAGTVGDTDLQTVAQRLNTAAHDQDKTLIANMKNETMQKTADLIAILITTQVKAGA